MLEKMSDFFNRRLDGYEEHQLHAIEQAETFYPITAEYLPASAGARVLDLGCGTGLELGYYFALNPAAEVTGIDLAGDIFIYPFIFIHVCYMKTIILRHPSLPALAAPLLSPASS